MSLATRIADLATRVATEFKTVRTELSSSMEQSRITVKNSSGATIVKGSAVYVSGANGTNVLISKAQANAEFSSSKTLGILAQDLFNNSVGYVITEGNLAGLDTSAATIGDPVWLSASTAGGLVFGIANKPVAPDHMVYIGVVTRVNSSNGEIFVHVQNGYEIDELHNVKITSPTAGQAIVHNGSYWVNDSVTASVADGSITDAKITASGLSPSSITGTAVITTDSRLSNSRTPTSHASTHGSAGSDPITIAQSQVTNLTTDLAGKAATSHTHSIADVTNLQTTLNGKADESVGTSFPTSPTANQLFVHTTKKTVYIYSGTEWIEFARPNAIEPLLLIGI